MIAQNDMITWLWNAAPEGHRTIRDIATRMIFLNVAAIHTTSAVNILTPHLVPDHRLMFPS